MNCVSKLPHLLLKARKIDGALAVCNHILNELHSCQDSVHDVQGAHEVMPNPDHSLVDCVDELTGVFLLAPHLDVNINLLEHRKEVFGPEQAGHLAE